MTNENAVYKLHLLHIVALCVCVCVFVCLFMFVSALISRSLSNQPSALGLHYVP
jgi:hypothetical protein